jgi:hypothetical protein
VLARPSGLTRVLWATTLLSALVLLAGAGIFLFGKRGAAPAAAPDAGSITGAVAPIVAPDGMIIVSDSAGNPSFFVDRKAVTNRQYAELIPSHKYDLADADKPALGVSYDYAVEYARLRGKRLLRTVEWPLALDTLGFTPAGMRTWEWVDDGAGTQAQESVRRVNNGVAMRSAAGDKTVTFRLASDLSGGIPPGAGTKP